MNMFGGANFCSPLDDSGIKHKIRKEKREEEQARRTAKARQLVEQVPIGESVCLTLEHLGLERPDTTLFDIHRQAVKIGLSGFLAEMLAVEAAEHGSSISYTSQHYWIFTRKS